MKQLIYKHTCTITNKSYIGQTINTMEERLNSHVLESLSGGKSHFHKAIRKYGIDNFISVILEDNIPIMSDLKSMKTIASEKEIFYIEKFNSFINGYNMTLGGEGTLGLEPWNKGKQHTSETKQKISNSMKNRSLSTSHKIKIGHSLIGHVVTEETKRKIRSSNTGLKRSEVTKRKNGEAHKGLFVGKIYEKILCPHCGKEGGLNVMHRWHFDNCKLR